MNLLTNAQINDLLQLAETTSERIMAFYNDGFEIQIKPDESPVTQADLAASALLEAGLPRIADYPVLSEENTPKTPDWLDWETYWLIDPIDGTKHFINRTGDFCICIALIHQHQVVLGLIYAPTEQTAWLAQIGEQPVKWQNGNLTRMRATAPETPIATLSSPTLTEKMATLIHTLPNCSNYQRGSALKYIDIVEGNASIYPKMWDTCEWDSAAGQCILACAGGAVVDFKTGEPLRYGTKPSLLNPHFLAHHYLSPQQLSDLLACYQKLQDQ